MIRTEYVMVMEYGAGFKHLETVRDVNGFSSRFPTVYMNAQ